MTEYLESWEKGTVATDTVRQQDTTTHIPNKTALTNISEKKKKNRHTVQVQSKISAIIQKWKKLTLLSSMEALKIIYFSVCAAKKK